MRHSVPLSLRRSQEGIKWDRDRPPSSLSARSPRAREAQLSFPRSGYSPGSGCFAGRIASRQRRPEHPRARRKGSTGARANLGAAAPDRAQSGGGGGGGGGGRTRGYRLAAEAGLPKARLSSRPAQPILAWLRAESGTGSCAAERLLRARGGLRRASAAAGDPWRPCGEERRGGRSSLPGH